MKRFFLFVSILSVQDCFSGTGAAYDAQLTIFAVILLIMLPVIVAYSLPFIKHCIQNCMERKNHEKHLLDHDGN
jgi:hypothetical protein